MPCTHVIATCVNDKEYGNKNTYAMCDEWHTVASYNKSYAGLFHLVPDSWYWTEYNGHTVLPPKVRRLWVARLLFAYVAL